MKEIKFEARSTVSIAALYQALVDYKSGFRLNYRPAIRMETHWYRLDLLNYPVRDKFIAQLDTPKANGTPYMNMVFDVQDLIQKLAAIRWISPDVRVCFVPKGEAPYGGILL